MSDEITKANTVLDEASNTVGYQVTFKFEDKVGNTINHVVKLSAAEIPLGATPEAVVALITNRAKAIKKQWLEAIKSNSLVAIPTLVGNVDLT